MPRISSSPCQGDRSKGALELARVLLVHSELAPRLALQTILQAGGYAVDVAASTTEALSKLDEGEYELVLTDSKLGSGRGGRNVLAYARVKDYRPATAVVTSYAPEKGRSARDTHQLAVHTENLPRLLGDVAELIGVRASRRHRPMRALV